MLKKINLECNDFGVVKAIRNYVIAPGEKLDTKSYANIEVVTYIVNGKMTTKDSNGNSWQLGRGEIHGLSAGNGISNVISNNEDRDLHIIQFEIMPLEQNLTPSVEAHKYKWKLRINHWLELVSNLDGEAQVRINQDVRIESLMLDEGETEGLAIDPDRKAILIQIEGSSEVNGRLLSEMEALEVDGEDIMLTGKEHSHFIVIEIAA